MQKSPEMNRRFFLRRTATTSLVGGAMTALFGSEASADQPAGYGLRNHPASWTAQKRACSMMFEPCGPEGCLTAIVWDVTGCPKSRILKREVLCDPEISGQLPLLFNIFMLNMEGTQSVDVPGLGEISEAALARHWGVTHSPTMQFFGDTSALQTEPLETHRLAGDIMTAHVRHVLNDVSYGHRQSAA